MSPGKVREEGFSKDADKLVRRLSLVALLLSRRGQPVSAEQVRLSVEGYPLMTTDAFKRRFYEDRAELARLGIEITAEPAAEGSGELYRLPADAYYLPPLELTREELAALGACLGVLGERFSHSQPLRLALLSLAQGRPEVLTDAAAPALMVLPEAGSGAGALPKLQAAIADRKTVDFAYYVISRDETMARRIDPYGLQLVAGEWYLIGFCHLRRALRTFRLSRISGRITYATRAPHDFEVPADFDLAAYRDRPAWQLGATQGRARLAVAPSLAWWVAAHWSHCGALTWLDGGGVVYETDYADTNALLGWVLGMGEAARIVAPEELRAQAVDRLSALRATLATPPPSVPAAPGKLKPTAPRPRADRNVEVDRFTRLIALAGYLVRQCGREDDVVLDVAAICADLGTTADNLRADVRLLNLVNFGADGTLLYAEFDGRRRLSVTCDSAGPAFARPARLSPLQADTLLLALELVGERLPSASGDALASAIAKLRALRSATPAGLGSSDPLPPDEHVLATVGAAIRHHRLLRIEYWAEGTDRLGERIVEPYLLVRSRGEWYYVCWCRKAAGTRVFRVATTKRAELLDEGFAPRAEVELDLYQREGIPTTGSYAPRSAVVWYSPRVRPWIAERQPVTPLGDGSCLARQPYVDESWLVSHLLSFAGEARPLEPASAVLALGAAVERLLTLYEAQ